MSHSDFSLESTTMSLASVASLASQPAGNAGANDRSTEFVAIENGTEQYSGGKLLVIAYISIWVILAGWIFLLWRKQQALGTRLDGLEAAIDRASAARDAKASTKAPRKESPAIPKTEGEHA
ncbi:hypothetical protein AKJ09_09410 [Labilithrix luteola]|uniref:CcmD family protein n=1 Tax=Labilithrix luteola TaxID=1391654 RepID=A0A0K1QAR2_9BACT|nr:CcmD family protein [Labilithrix luteola]AKV02747.1 hypothetical protein AKJ09_09410 [Labilithrix luteola]